MPTNTMTQRHKTGDVSFKASAAVTGKRFLKITGDRTGGMGLSTDLQNVYVMAQCVSGDVSVGVSKYDVAINKRGGCAGQPGQIVVVTSGAAITAGVEVQSDANGKAITLAAGKRCGIAMSGASGVDVDVEVKLT